MISGCYLSARQQFIRRKKIIGYHRENYRNFALFLKRLMEATDKVVLDVLREEIWTAGAVAEREWLLGEG